MGMVEVGDDTRRELVEYARGTGPIAANGSADTAVMEMMSLIAATREYQFC
jgi:hypothetical protein